MFRRKNISQRTRFCRPTRLAFRNCATECGEVKCGELYGHPRASRRLVHEPRPKFTKARSYHVCSYRNQSLDMALTSSSGYDPSQAYIYTGLQSRYFTVWSSYILTSLLQVTSTAGAITNQRVSSLYPTRAGLDATQVGYISNPTGSTFDNQSPMPFTVRVLVSLVRSTPVLHR